MSLSILLFDTMSCHTFQVSAVVVCTLFSVAFCGGLGGGGGGSKKVIIHVPLIIKDHHHTVSLDKLSFEI